MKHFKLIVLLTLLGFVACDEYEHGPSSTDSVNPSKVENATITPINGGFDISYDLPDDKDLLYVKAVYLDNKGVEAEVKTSAFDNKIQILGFNDLDEKTIRLYAVDRSENISEPVVITGTPLISPLHLVQQQLAIKEDFGGAKFSWKNETKAPISIALYSKNAQGKLELVKTQYSSQKEASVSLRGFEPVPTLFAAVIRDRYDNFSDTIYANTPDKLLTPLFEERLNKTLFKKVVLQNDISWNAWGGNYFNLFDNDEDTFAHTQGDHVGPSMLTVDLGVNVNLSRINVLQRQDLGTWAAFTHGNPKKYAIYGSKELPGTDGNLANWIKLRDCESTKPSGLPLGQNTDEDVAHFLAGDEYNFDNAPEIRYLRFVVYETWDGSSYIDFSEITFWGNIVK